MKKQYEAEYRLDGMDKKGKKTYTYIGSWYTFDLDEAGFRSFWRRQLGFSILILALLIGAGCISSMALYAFYSAIPYGISLILSLFLTVETIFCPTHPEKSEHLHYDQSFGHIRSFVSVCPVLFAVSFAGNLIAMLVYGMTSARELIQPALLLAAFIAGWFFHKLEKNTPVKIIDNDAAEKV